MITVQQCNYFQLYKHFKHLKRHYEQGSNEINLPFSESVFHLCLEKFTVYVHVQIVVKLSFSEPFSNTAAS